MSDQNNNPFDPNANFNAPNAPGQASGQPAQPTWQAPNQAPAQTPGQTVGQPQYQQPQAGYNQFQAAPGFGNPTEMERQRLTGIGGLLILYIVLTGLWLVLQLFNISGLLWIGGPIDWVLFIGVFGLAAAGLVLIFMRKKVAISINIIGMGLAMVKSIWGALTVNTSIAAMGGYGGYGYDEATAMAVTAGVVIGVIFSIAFNTLWIVYFLKSKRVKYTLTQ